ASDPFVALMWWGLCLGSMPWLPLAYRAHAARAPSYSLDPKTVVFDLFCCADVVGALPLTRYLFRGAYENEFSTPLRIDLSVSICGYHLNVSEVNLDLGLNAVGISKPKARRYAPAKVLSPPAGGSKKRTASNRKQEAHSKKQISAHAKRQYTFKYL
ncbi:MAG: hypothetical protein R3Y08_09310, partial [Rikenellaceae bacterium]